MLVFGSVWSYMKFQQTLVLLNGQTSGDFFLKKKHWIVWFGWQIFIQLGWKNHLHSRKLTWNLKMMVSNRNLLFQVSIFGCHVSFRECNGYFGPMMLMVYHTRHVFLVGNPPFRRVFQPQYFRSEFHKRTLGMVFLAVFFWIHIWLTHFLLNQAKCSSFWSFLFFFAATWTPGRKKTRVLHRNCTGNFPQSKKTTGLQCLYGRKLGARFRKKEDFDLRWKSKNPDIGGAKEPGMIRIFLLNEERFRTLESSKSQGCQDFDHRNDDFLTKTSLWTSRVYNILVYIHTLLGTKISPPCWHFSLNFPTFKDDRIQQNSLNKTCILKR